MSSVSADRSDQVQRAEGEESLCHWMHPCAQWLGDPATANDRKMVGGIVEGGGFQAAVSRHSKSSCVWAA